jgi:ATPase subunit of ABC transporter with duplicated ATPase domains
VGPPGEVVGGLPQGARALISVSNLAKEFGDRPLFAGASFQLNPGERYGLVGANGSGKTTLLNILSGELDPTEGTVSIPKDLRLGVLRQDQFLYEEEDILGVALMGNPELWDAMVEKAELLGAARQDPEAFDTERFSRLEETVQRNDGYAAEARAASILEGLGLPAEVHRSSLSTLSGGFKLRVLLAQTLAAAPDVLLLDEPTNHLDILSIRWLEKFLADFAGPVVVISHDHRFLDNVSTHILDVDYETVLLYPGNYTDFVQAKHEERERREKEIATREKEIAHHQEFVDRFRAKASKARQAQSKLRMIEKKAEGLEELPGSSRRYPTFRFEQVRPSGREVLKVKGVEKAFGDNEVLHGVDLEVRRGDRLAIMGPNGIGKSTLLKIMVGELEADRGEVAWGYETHPGYFAQDHHEQLEESSRSAEEWLWDFCPGKDRGYVRNQMGLVLFSGDDGAKALTSLSGGEAARLVFACLMLERPNILVLDEPTNHLDLESIEALVEGLKAYEGTLVLVSHDRWFVKQLATRVVEIQPGAIRDYPGTYEEYVHATGDDHLDADTVVLKARREKRKVKKEAEEKKRRRREREEERQRNEERAAAKRRRRLEDRSRDLLVRIEAAEARIEEIHGLFGEPGYYDRTPPDEVAELDAERSRLEDELGRLMGEWERAERELAREAGGAAEAPSERI